MTGTDVSAKKNDSQCVLHLGSMFEEDKLTELPSSEQEVPNSVYCESEQEVLNSVYCELEQERNAAATAANEAMSVISRLQKEKAMLQMEARHYHQIVEEKAFYDQEAITLFKDIILKQEAEKLVLEREVDVYRQRLLKLKLRNSEGAEEAFQDLPLDIPILDGKGGSEDILGKDSPSETGESPKQLSIYMKDSHQTVQPDEMRESCLCMVRGDHADYETRPSTAGAHSCASRKDEFSKNLAAKTKDIVGQVDYNSIKRLSEEHWQVVLNQLSNLEEQIWNLRAIQLYNFKEYPSLVESQSLKDWSCKTVCEGTKQQDQISEQKGNSGSKENEKQRRLMERRTWTEQQELSQGNPKRRFYVECSSDVLEDVESNCLCVDNFNVYKHKHFDHPSNHPLNLGAGFDGILESRVAIELLKFGSKTTSEQPDRSKGPFSVSNYKTEPTCENTRKKGVSKKQPCAVSVGDRHPGKLSLSLEETVEISENRLQALEAAMTEMTEAMEMLKQNVGQIDRVHEMAQQSCANEKQSSDFQAQGRSMIADLLKGFPSFTRLSCNLLDLLGNLAYYLKRRVRLAEDEDLADFVLCTAVGTYATISKDDTPFTEETDTLLNKLPFLRSTSLTWMSDVRGRSGTAFAGWDL